MPKNMVRNKLLIMCNYTYRNFKGSLMPSKLTPTCHAVVLYCKLVTQSPIIYYGMPKNTVRNKLLIMGNYTYRNFKGNFMPSKLTPTCSCSCFVQFKLVTQSPIIYYGMPKSVVRNKLFNACRETPHVV